MTRKKFSGIIPPVVTVFDEKGCIDHRSNKKVADFLISKGVHGLAYLGTSGEFASMTLEEKKDLIKTMVNHIQGKVPILAGVGSTSLKETKELIGFCEEVGVDGLLVINPYFSKYPENNIYEYFSSIASSTSLPIVLYNFPDLTGQAISVTLAKKLVSTYSNIVGIKESLNDIADIREMLTIKEIKPDFAVFCAYEYHMLATFILGVDGSINATANCMPEYSAQLYEAVQTQNWEEAIKFHKKVCDAMNLYALSNPLFLAIKEGVYQRVLGQTKQERLPSLGLSQEKKELVKKILEEAMV
jgi:4-hydroxy-tetrahydrodipicolinate synthase